MRSTRFTIPGFEDGEMGSPAPESGQPAEAGKGNKTDSPVELPERNTAEHNLSLAQ